MKNPLDLIVAKLHVVANGFFLPLPNIFAAPDEVQGDSKARGARRGSRG